jgi:phosphorylcholine metabolism protein LicD
MKLLGALPIQTLLLLSSALVPTLAGAVDPARRLEAREEKKRDTKYFHEPGMGDHLSHYDARYYKGEVVYEQHRANLQHLIRSYLTVFKTLGIETFLAHGTLLGWWWNGKIMPWDYDLDVQVSNETMAYMAKHFNRTMHLYEYVDEKTGMQANKTFLLDVNPHSLDLTRGDGQNVIDARWIDIENGMFVDITGLAEREKEKNPGLWSCKNYHRYRTRDLYPMRETEYEGVSALVPYSFEKILIEEYGPKSLVMTEWLK